MLGDERTGVFQRDRRQDAVLPPDRFGLGLGHHQDDVPEDTDAPGIAAFGDQRLVEGRAMLDLERQRLAGAEDVVGEMRRGADAARRAAGLDQHRPALRRGHAGQRAFDFEERTGMVDRSDLARVLDDGSGFAIPDEGVGLDARPQRLADVDEFFHAIVSRIVLHQFVEAVIGRIAAPRRGDDVEGDASIGDVIQRVEQTRHVERMHEGRRIGQPEADMLGVLGQHRDERTHVLARKSDAPMHRLVERAAPRARHAEPSCRRRSCRCGRARRCSRPP